MTKTTNPDLTQGLRTLYAESESARKLLDAMAERKQDRMETSVERAAQIARIDVKEAASVLKRLADLKAAKWRYGRHGYKTRVEWEFSQISLGKIARGEASEPEQVDTSGEREPKVGDEIGNPEGVILLLHQIRIRQDLVLDFNLPSDFSMREAERLGDWLKTLPFQN